MMRENRFRLSIVLGVIALFVSIGCSSESTPEVCNEVCNLFADDQCWGFDLCVDECLSEGDWGGIYLDCVRNADGCAELEACDVF